MKILAFTDIHNSEKQMLKVKEKALQDKPDLVICSGDFTVMGRSTENMLKHFNDLGKPFYFTHGNHEDEYEIRKLVKKYPNLHFLHKETCVVNDILFLWYGGGGFSSIDKRFESLVSSFEKKMQNYSKVVMITHGPPYKTNLDPIVGEPCGNLSYKQFLVKHCAKIVLYLCGHLHENFHKHDQIGNCKLINPGPDGEIIEI